MRRAHSSSATRAIRRTAIVEHDAARMQALVADVAAYPAFLPWCVGATLGESGPEGRLATLEVGIRGLRQRFTTRYRSDVPGEIDIRLVEGPFRAFHAHWRFVPLAEQASRVEFEMAYEFAGPAVSAALGPLFETIADTMVDAFTRRADAGGR